MTDTFTVEKISRELLEIFSKHVKTHVTVSETASLFGDLELDSLTIMEIIADMEDRFEVRIDGMELFEISTMKEVIELLSERLRELGRLK